MTAPKKRPRRLSCKVTVSDQVFHRTVLEAAVLLTMETVLIRKRMHQRPFRDLRAVLKHAYEKMSHVIQEQFPKFEKELDAGANLYGLQIEMRPTLGVYKVDITLRREHSVDDQAFSITIGSPDGHTTFTRNATTPVAEVGVDKSMLALDKHRVL